MILPTSLMDHAVMDSFKSTPKDSQISELQAYIRKLEEIINMIPGNVWWKDTNGIYEGCNGNLAHIYELNHWKEIIGKTDIELQKDSCLVDQTLAHDHDVISNNRESIFVETGFNVDKQKAYYMTRKKPMVDEDGNVIGLIGISIDVTQEKETERLREKDKISKKVIQHLKTIAGSLAHEIKTPLAGVRTGLSLLKNFFTQVKKDMTQLSVESIEKQEQWILRMIDRIDSGNTLIAMQLKNMTTENIDTSEFQTHSIRQCIQEALQTFPFDDDKAVEKVHVCVNEDFKFWSSALLIKHVLWNLLNNAFHFMKETDRGEIFITAESTTEYHVLRFKDTAKGMLADEATQVFEQFYSKRQGGCGLGLHFCKLVVEACQGRIECQAQEGQYTEFLLFFPKELVFDPNPVRLEAKEFQV